MTRERLVEVADSYCTGLANQTGNFVAPFAPSCERTAPHGMGSDVRDG